ncbi:PepSY domain-containing protein [Arhodomonas sp. AD133]|uniref:PepSY domain-containing protein n=1 Tax=Arhodomonas sp. AD133 TaxID=3415009 RepID=UPI003EBDEA8E
MIRTLALATLIAVAGATSAMDVVLAQNPGDLSLDQAVRQVERRTGGEVLSAETVTTGNGTRIHRLRVLVAEGRVRIIEIAAGGQRY